MALEGPSSDSMSPKAALKGTEVAAEKEGQGMG